ncbi:AEC family transporter [Enterococcus faecium]|uniref:AEC family transporter n=1 Tax=Enterococcus faecium TaxID=1352 RepID=UPI00339012EB
MLLFYIIIGVILGKNGLEDTGLDSFSLLLTNIALPCAILNSFQVPFTKENALLFAKTIVIALLFFFGLFLLSILSANVLRIPSQKRNVWIGCGTFSSVLFIGIPIVEALFGSKGLIVLVALNTIGNIFLFGFGESIFAGRLLVNIKHIFRSPAILAALLGLLFFVVGFSLPDVLLVPIQNLAGFTSPLSMIINGALLSKTLSLKLFTNKDTLLFCFVRLIIFPIVIFFIFNLFIRDPFFMKLIILVACMPSGAVNSVFAEKYNSQGSLASNYIIVSTLCCIVTIPLMFSLLF